MRKKRIYLDVCCLNRPFDDLSQDRIYLEAEAILSIISHCERGEWILVASSIIDFELSRIRDAERLEKVQNIYRTARERLFWDTKVEEMAKMFQKKGLKAFDSLHLALAETQGVDVFLTTDDQLFRSAGKLNLNIKVANPILWLMEVVESEQ
jgi:predicted nucleic acid-binding protein